MSSGSTRCAATSVRSDASEPSRSSAASRWRCPHRRVGQTCVTGSSAWTSWLRPTSVKTLSGYELVVGSRCAGRRPVKIAGTATYVPSLTVVALRYHVDVAARRPKFGSRPASTRRLASISEIPGSSSKITSTTGVRDDADSATAAPCVVAEQLGDRREREERHEKDDRRDAEDRQHAAQRLQARVRDHDPGGRERRQRQQHRARVGQHALEQPDRQERAEQRDEHEVHDARDPRSEEPRADLDEQHDRGRREHEHEREQHDVGARVVAGDEELGVAREVGEQRLDDRERPQGKQMQPRDRALAPRPRVLVGPEPRQDGPRRAHQALSGRA